MSYEGHIQLLCEEGHLTVEDAMTEMYTPENFPVEYDECPCCHNKRLVACTRFKIPSGNTKE